MSPSRPDQSLRFVGIRSWYVVPVDWTTLPRVLKELRKASGQTMKELAAKMRMSDDTVDAWEGGRRTPDPEKVEAFINACGKKLVFEIVEPTTEVMPLDVKEQELVSMWRAFAKHPERRRALIEFGSLLPGAQPGAEGAALGVLRTLQQAPAVEKDRWSVGDPDE